MIQFTQRRSSVWSKETHNLLSPSMTAAASQFLPEAPVFIFRSKGNFTMERVLCQLPKMKTYTEWQISQKQRHSGCQTKTERDTPKRDRQRDMPAAKTRVDSKIKSTFSSQYAHLPICVVPGFSRSHWTLPNGGGSALRPVLCLLYTPVSPPLAQHRFSGFFLT